MRGAPRWFRDAVRFAANSKTALPAASWASKKRRHLPADFSFLSGASKTGAPDVRKARRRRREEGGRAGGVRATGRADRVAPSPELVSLEGDGGNRSGGAPCQPGGQPSALGGFCRRGPSRPAPRLQHGSAEAGYPCRRGMHLFVDSLEELEPIEEVFYECTEYATVPLPDEVLLRAVSPWERPVGIP